MTIRPKKTEGNTTGLTQVQNKTPQEKIQKRRQHKRIEHKIRQHKARQDLG